MYLTFVGVIALICTILAIAKEGRHSANYVFTAFEPNSGWTPGWSWVVGILHAAYANSATGMVISMSEEVKSPSTQVPKAMLSATVMNFVIGFVFLGPLTFVLPDINAFLNDPYGQPVPVILRSAVGSEVGAFILSVPLILLGVLCGTACTTATSRCVWAFARDNAMPGSNWLKKVNIRLGVPLNGMICSFVIQAALGLIWFGSHAAFNAFNGVGVIFLNLSYVMPIGISLFRGRKDLVGSPFNLGTVGGTIANVVSVGKSKTSCLKKDQKKSTCPESS
jgi:amino acid transporter